MMRFLLLLACGLVCVMSAPVTPDDVTQDRFITFIKGFEHQPFFKTILESYRILTFELTTAAETNNLGAMLEQLGYLQLLKYLEVVPSEFSHDFITYIVEHLEAEAGPVNESFFKP